MVWGKNEINLWYDISTELILYFYSAIKYVLTPSTNNDAHNNKKTFRIVHRKRAQVVSGYMCIGKYVSEANEGDSVEYIIYFFNFFFFHHRPTTFIQYDHVRDIVENTPVFPDILLLLYVFDIIIILVNHVNIIFYRRNKFVAIFF